MAEPQDSNIEHNKCEANVAGEMISSNGPNFQIAGAPDFPAGIWNNALRVDANTEIVQLVNTPPQFDFAKGIIDFHIKMTVDIVNGKSGGGQKPRVLTWWKDANEFFQITFHNTLGLIWNLFDGVGADAWNNTHADLDITANTWAHLIFAWNRAGIGVTANTRRMYLNGNPVGADNQLFIDTDMTTAEAILGLLFNGAYFSNGEVQIENFKWGGDCTEAIIIAVINNKDTEDWPVSGYPIANKYNFKQHGGLTCH